MKKIIIHEVGMRDGLQMEKQIVPIEKKLAWITSLIEAGVDILQVGSFVHPEKVPQMADTDRLFAELAVRKHSDTTLSGLVLNEKGLERAMNAGVEMICMGVSASDTHSRKNTGMTAADATERIVAMGRQAVAAGKRVQVSVQSAFGCGYEGPVPQERVISIVRRYNEAGLTHISLADTAGHAMPDAVERLFESLFTINPSIEAACHFHNTYGLGLANVYAAMKAGVQNYESSVAGLGGCPFTKIAGGNVCTEDLIHMMHRMNLRNDIRLEAITAVARDVAGFFKRDMSGIIYKSGPIDAGAAAH
jgi:hydroxymethylglutaryl-CoA lyase